MAPPLFIGLMAVFMGVPSPLIGRIFARSSAEILRTYPSCTPQSIEPLALRCPMTLYGVANSTLFLFDEVHRVTGVIVQFAPQANLDRLQKWLKPLLNDLVTQFGMPNRPRPVHETVTWNWSHNRAVVEVKLQKLAPGKWTVQVAFAEARPPNPDEVPGPKAAPLHPQGVSRHGSRR